MPAQLDALRLSSSIQRRLVDLACDSNFVRNQVLAEICRIIWNGTPEAGGLLSEIWVEGAFPSESPPSSPRTLTDLVEAELFTASLRDHLHQRGVFPQDRRLYTHQVECIRRAGTTGDGPQPALIVSAGTGAGKTECFLLPILNRLWGRPREGRQGVRCIILYPMNALVNDQVDRVYEWLRGQHDLTVFHFTSDTAEDARAAARQGVPRWDPCRRRTRQQARGWEDAQGHRLERQQLDLVPDILITNYSMLEYMLCRPQDHVFFGSGLDAVVLDEAHLYTGTLAAEIALLLRRAMQRCGRQSDELLQVATSATIGTGRPGELRDFAAKLFSKNSRHVAEVQGRARQAPMEEPDGNPNIGPKAICERRWLWRPTIELDVEGHAQIARDASVCDQLAEDLQLIVAPHRVAAARESADDCPAVLLFEALRRSPLVHRISEVLWERRCLPLQELCQHVWQDRDEGAVGREAMVHLLRMAACARRNAGDFPLVPHRIHILARGGDGLCVCMNPLCTGPSERRLPPLGTVHAGYHERCPACGALALLLLRCSTCGEMTITGTAVGDGCLETPRIEFAGRPAQENVRFYRLADSGEMERVTVAPQSGNVTTALADGPALVRLEGCPNCHTTHGDAWKPFVSSTALALSVVSETMLAAIPPYPAARSGILPARGRRLLTFSDSRQEAARLGPRLTSQHEMQVLRSMLAQCVRSSEIGTEARRERTERKIRELREELRSPTLDSDLRLEVEEEFRQAERRLEEYDAGGSVESWTRRVGQAPQVAELLDVLTAQRHIADGWDDSTWQANADRIRQELPRLLMTEVARPFRGGFVGPVETLGLVEVVYPGLESLAIPDVLSADDPPAMGHVLAWLGGLPPDALREVSGGWLALLAMLCDTLREDGAVTLGSHNLDREYPSDARIGTYAAKNLAQSPVRFVGETLRQRRMAFAAAVLQKAGLGPERAGQEAPLLLGLAYDLLEQTSGRLRWLEAGTTWSRTGEQARGIRIRLGDLCLRRPPQLFRSPRTWQVFPSETLGCAPFPGCDDLQPVTDEELDRDPRVGRRRRELLGQDDPAPRGERVFDLGLWAEEHSAQLSPQENRRLQELFKRGIRNVLSSTTTLELGVDIGGLNGVLIGNVPPGKANYLQRAGRAGRRSDGSSVAVTFVRERPFDREVFRRFGRYLGAPLRTPSVFLDRPRIARRHMHSLLLGEFFGMIYPPGTRVGAMNAFGRMGTFAGEALPPYWRHDESDRPSVGARPQPWIRPEELRVHLREGHTDSPGEWFLAFLRQLADHTDPGLQERLDQVVWDTPLQQAVDGNWHAVLTTAAADFQKVMDGWLFDWHRLRRGWDSADDRAQANAIRYQMKALHEVTVIEALADAQFLPRYGFPIGLQRLRVIVSDENGRGGRPRVREEDQYRLERAGLLALREFAPGCRLMVGGQIVTCHGLLKHWTGADLDNYLGLQGRIAECTEGHFHYSFSSQPQDEPQPCPFCGSPEQQSTARQLLMPRHGFSTAVWEPPHRGGDVDRVGHVERHTVAFTQDSHDDVERSELAGIPGLVARYREGGDIAVFNAGEHGRGFAVCTRCGYSTSETAFGQGRIDLPSGFNAHMPLSSRRGRCWRDEESPVLRNRILASRETTDVLFLDLSPWTTSLPNADVLARTTALALRLAGARLMGLDSRELGSMVVPAGPRGAGWAAVLYDNVPGGAGHVREVLEAGREWFEVARKDVLYVSEVHHRTCRLACLDCLLTFDSQEDVAAGNLDRRLCHDFLEGMLGNGVWVPPTGPHGSTGIGSTGDAGRPSDTLTEGVYLPENHQASGRPTDEQRRRQARDRLSRRRS